MSRHAITSQKALRATFWRENPQALIREGGKRKPQNRCKTDTRQDFCAWLDSAANCGRITGRMVQTATL
jgi:hypothetical protein